MVFIIFNKEILNKTPVTDTNKIVFFIFLVILILYMMLSIFLLNYVTKDKRTRARMVEMDQRKLNKVLKEKTELQSQLNKIEKS